MAWVNRLTDGIELTDKDSPSEREQEGEEVAALQRRRFVIRGSWSKADSR
jgi:hypothetical protein